MDQPLSPERQQCLEEVLGTYLEAIDAGLPADRKDFVTRHPDLAAELERFFAEEDKFSWFAAPLRPIAQAARIDAADTDVLAGTLHDTSGPGIRTVPCSFGDYELLEEIAAGGMGVVYKARQRSLNRLVALKMILAGPWATRADVQRFRNEAETVAQLDHSHIVPIHEVGEYGGQVYFSMKLIEGGSLSDSVKSGQPAANDRNQARHTGGLMATVARAVHYAHQRGILHRDLKPANILLDQQGEPHVTDFGLAKQLPSPGQELDKASLTQSGALIGTPSYMAPEQASGMRGAVTTATDVYGLGAILYALLAGRPPFRGETFLDTLDQVQKREPEFPSRSNPAVDHDLETICLKSLEKEPSRRYRSAEELADDLERWLAGEPIMARPISRMERLSRWCRRNPFIAAAAAMVVLAVVSLAGSAVFAWRARQEALQQRDLADVQRQRADQRSLDLREAVEVLTRIGENALADIPQTETARRELLEEALKFNQRFVQAEPGDPGSLGELGKAYLLIGKLQNDLGHTRETREAFQHAQAIFEELTGQFDDRGDFWESLAQCYEGPGLAALDNPKVGEQAARQALAIRQRLVEKFPNNMQYDDALARNYHALGNLLLSNTEFGEAEKAFRQALATAEKLVAECPKAPGYRKALADILASLGKLLMDGPRHAEAEKVIGRAAALREELAKEFPKASEYRNQLGDTQVLLGQVLETIKAKGHDAEQAYRKAVAIYDQAATDFPSFPIFRAQGAIIRVRHLGMLLMQQGRLNEAAQTYQEVAAIYQKMAVDFPDGYMHKLARVNLGETYGGLGEVLINAGRYAEAIQAFAQMQDVCTKAAEDFPDVTMNRNNLANSYFKQGELLKIDGQLPKAEAAYLRALEVQIKVVKEVPEHPLYRETLGIIHIYLATARSLLGHRTDAEHDLQQARSIFEQLVKENPEDAKHRWQLAWFLAAFPDAQLCDPRRATELLKPTLEQNPQDAMAWLALGIARCRLSEWQSAIEPLNKSVELREGGQSHEWFYLALAQVNLGQKEQARKAYDRAVEWMEKNRPKDAELRYLRDEIAALLAKNETP